MLPFSRILVYLDGSEGSMNALMYSIMLAKETGAELNAVYVVNVKALSDLTRYHVFIDKERNEYQAELEKDASRHIRHAEKLASKKDLRINAVRLEGTPHQVILDFIKEHEIDLLALGGINVIKSRRDELTSESDRMLRTVPCPVVVIRDDADLWDRFDN